MKDLFFDDWDLRRGWISGEVVFEWDLEHVPQADPAYHTGSAAAAGSAGDSYLMLYLSESASLEHLSPLRTAQGRLSAGGIGGEELAVSADAGATSYTFQRQVLKKRPRVLAISSDLLGRIYRSPVQIML